MTTCIDKIIKNKGILSLYNGITIQILLSILRIISLLIYDKYIGKNLGISNK